MKHPAIVPAEIDFSDPQVPWSPRFEDRYHGSSGAFEQARHVFLGGNGLPARWCDRDAFTVLETGFGLGNNFLATWAAWRADVRRPARLRFISIEKHPLRLDDLRQAQRGSPEPALAAQLCAAWPPLTPDLHLLAFDDDRVELLLAFGDATERLREIVASVDAFYLDGFAPARNPEMWGADLFKALARLAAPGATVATWNSARPVRDGLRQAGFDWHKAAGIGGKREISRATFTPRVFARPPRAREVRDGVKRVAIIGGGLAGAATARALAHAGLQCLVFERHAEPAAEASGNVAGLFHGVFHADDGMHARAHRAAALMAQRDYRQALAEGVPGRCDGLLRLQPDAADVAPLLASLARSGLPASYLQAWSPAQVQAAGGPACAAWFYPGGGWIAPAALSQHWLRGPGIHWRGGVSVTRLEQLTPDTQDPSTARGVATNSMPRSVESPVASSIESSVESPVESSAGSSVSSSVPRSSQAPAPRPLTWRLFGADGCPVADVDAVVFANAGAALALWTQAEARDGLAADARWISPLASTRGQVTLVAADTPGLRAPRLPVAGSGYALTLGDGAAMCGATTSSDDSETNTRLEDHAYNLRQLIATTASTLTPDGNAPDAAMAGALIAQGRLSGRVGWRATAIDRLPLIGGVPMQPPFAPADFAGGGDRASPPALPDQARHWPRVPGLFVVAGFGSRGLTWAPLAGRLLASWIVGAPFPLPADLIDALDPARFAVRVVRAARRPPAKT